VRSTGAVQRRTLVQNIRARLRSKRRPAETTGLYGFSQVALLKRVGFGFRIDRYELLRFVLNLLRLTMSEMMPLTALHSGQIAEIGQLLGPKEQVRRLEELGLRAGARLEMISTGSPCIVRVDGSRICFRHDDSLRVMVNTRMLA
jgi:ferrous iron transport protein A